jgi:hypothetical protein
VADALDAFALGKSALTTQRLATLDKALASRRGGPPGASGAMRARGCILVVLDGLTQHAEYFDAGASR